MSTRIHSFPNEILHQVFQETIRNNTTAPRPPPSLTRAPFNISQVCSRWRDIALHPTFWADIVLVGPTTQSVLLHELFRRRAFPQLRPGSMSMTYIAKSDDKHQEDEHRPLSRAVSSELNFMYAMMNVVNRSEWREVDLDFSFHGPLHLRQKSITLGPFPSTERLSLAAPKDCCTRIQSYLNLSKSHQLKMLSLRGDWDVYSSLPPFLGDFRPALPSLTTLEFDLVGDVEVYSSFVQCIRLFANAPNLHTLTLRSMSGRPSFPYPKQLPRLKNLRNLRVVIAAGQSASIACCFASIDLPVLQQLVVQTLHDAAVREPLFDLGACVVNCLRRSQCPLEMLKIHSSVLAERWIIAMLRQAPLLRSLVLSGCGTLSNKLLSALLTRPTFGSPPHAVSKIVFDNCTSGAP